MSPMLGGAERGRGGGKYPRNPPIEPPPPHKLLPSPPSPSPQSILSAGIFPSCTARSQWRFRSGAIVCNGEARGGGGKGGTAHARGLRWGMGRGLSDGAQRWVCKGGCVSVQGVWERARGEWGGECEE